MSASSKIGSVGNDNVDPSSIPTELFEIDTENKLIRLKDDWNFDTLKNSSTTAQLLYTLMTTVSGGVTTSTPTLVGAGIIESGYVSGRGRYIKYGDGTMIQWRYDNTRLSCPNVYNGPIGNYGWSFYYGGITYTYPIPFYSNPFVVGSTDSGTVSIQNISASNLFFVPYVIGNSALCVGWIAYGRWKA